MSSQALIRKLLLLLFVGLLLPLAPGTRAVANEKTAEIGPNLPPGAPFQDCVRGIIGTVKGYWCFVGELKVFVPDQ